MPDIKEQLYILCAEYIRTREADIKQAMTDAQEAANNETKSSAGDKYETGREMMQQEIEMGQARLNELKKIRSVLEHIAPTQLSATVIPGSVVYTSNGNYYLSISAGQLKVDGIAYYAISAASPIGTKLIGQKSGYEFILNGKKFIIEKVA